MLLDAFEKQAQALFDYLGSIFSTVAFFLDILMKNKLIEQYFQL